MSQISEEAYRYNKWANLQLLDICAGLSEEQLQLSAPGTYGTIAATLLHLLSAEQRYVKRLGGSEPRISEKDEFPGVAELKRQAERSGDELIELVPKITRDTGVEAARPSGRFKVKLWVVAVQAIHHGNDHRTHICTILGHHKIQDVDIDVWTYGQSVGAYVELTDAR